MHRRVDAPFAIVAPSWRKNGSREGAKTPRIFIVIGASSGHSLRQDAMEFIVIGAVRHGA